MAYETNSGQKKVDQILDLYGNSRHYYKTFRDNWLTYYKQYRSYLDASTTKDYYKWRSKLFIPATARAVDGWVDSIMLTAMAPKPFFSLSPREEADVAQAKLMETLLDYQFEESNFFVEIYKFVKQVAIYGTAFGKVHWEKKTKTVKKKEEFMGIEIGEPQEVEETTFDGPVFKALDIFDVYVSPKATSLDDTWVIHRSEKKLSDLKALAKQDIYKNVAALENYFASSTPQEQAERKSMQGLPEAYGKEEGDNRMIEILEYWNSDRTKTCTIAAQRFIIREERENPFSGMDPFVHGTLSIIPFELYSIGHPERVKDLQDQLNSEVNQRLDNRNLRQNMIVKVRRGANVNVRNLITKPGGIWLTDDMTAIEPVQVPETGTSSSFAEENLLKQEIEEATGITKFSRGSGAEGSRKTATEASLQSRAGTKSFALQVMLLEEMVLKPTIEKFYQLDQLFMTEERIVRIAGQSAQFVAVSPPDALQTFDIKANASSELMDKNLKVQQMIQMLQIAAQDPTLNRQELYKRIWEAWGYKDYNQLFNAQQPPMGLPGAAGGLSGGNPTPPTGMRAASPQEGGVGIPMGLGGVRPNA